MSSLLMGIKRRSVNGMWAKDDPAATRSKLRREPGALRYAAAEKQARAMAPDTPI